MLIWQAWELLMEGKTAEFEKISELCVQPEMLRSIHVGLLCVQKLGEDRRPVSTIFQCSAAKLLNFPHRRSPHLSEAPLRSSLSNN